MSLLQGEEGMLWSGLSAIEAAVCAVVAIIVLFFLIGIWRDKWTSFWVKGLQAGGLISACVILGLALASPTSMSAGAIAGVIVVGYFMGAALGAIAGTVFGMFVPRRVKLFPSDVLEGMARGKITKEKAHALLAELDVDMRGR